MENQPGPSQEFDFRQAEEKAREYFMPAEQAEAYLNDIQKATHAREKLNDPAISDEEQRSLQAAIRQGEDAERLMIVHREPMVRRLAERYQKPGVDLEDLIQAGNLALIEYFRSDEALETVRHSASSSPLSSRVERGMMEQIAGQGYAIKYPTTWGEISRKTAEKQAELGRALSVDEAATVITQTVGPRALEYAQSLQPGHSARVHEMEPAVSLSEGNISAVEQNLDRSYEIPSSDKEALVSIVRAEIETVLRTITERERAIIKLRFGLDDEEPMTLEEVGQRFGLVRESVRQIEAKALAKLRHPSRAVALQIDDTANQPAKGLRGPEKNLSIWSDVEQQKRNAYAEAQEKNHAMRRGIQSSMDAYIEALGRGDKDEANRLYNTAARLSLLYKWGPQDRQLYDWFEEWYLVTAYLREKNPPPAGKDKRMPREVVADAESKLRSNLYRLTGIKA